MLSDIVLRIFGMALYIGLFAALPFIIRRQPEARHLAIVALLVPQSSPQEARRPSAR
jgi:hypothetical protein